MKEGFWAWSGGAPFTLRATIAKDADVLRCSNHRSDSEGGVALTLATRTPRSRLAISMVDLRS
jgi:hypothetical protein